MARVDLLRLATLLALLPSEEWSGGPVHFEPPRDAERPLPPRAPGWWPVDSTRPPKNLGSVVGRMRAAEAKRARKAAKLEALAAKGAIRRKP